MIAEVTVIRAFTTRARGDLPRAIELFHRALELLPSKELHLRAVAAGGLADAHYMSGDILTAGSLFPEASAIGWEGGNIYMASFSARRLAEVQAMQGYLHQAADTYQQMLQLLARRGEQHATVAGNAYVGMGAIICEWNDLDAAVQQLREGIERGKQGVDTRILLPGYVALTRALQGLGDAAGALAAIQEAMQLWQHYQATRLWSVPPVPTYQARLWLAQGDVASAAQWAQEQGLRADGEFSYQREVDYLTLARLLIAQGNANQAAGLLERLLGPAETGGRTTRVIEIMMLQALAFQAGGDTTRAMDALERALTLAEPGGFIRIFVDEGPPMEALLRRMKVENGNMEEYVRKLLAAFADKEFQPPSLSPQPLIEPLSERELEVLQLLAEGLTNQEIGSRLFLSLNTVKVHTRNIYGKLNVHSRTQAIARSQEIGLLPRK